MSHNIPNRAAPARGARDGVKKDFQQAVVNKLSGNAEVDAEAGRGGSAWSHNFLNQKPWHPGSYRNRLKTWESEQDAIAEAKLKEQAKAEFEAEQEVMKTLSYLSAEEQQKYRDRQSIQFMYAKPPGLDAVLAKEKEQAQKQEKDQKALVDASKADPAAQQQQLRLQEEEKQRLMDMDKVRADPYAAMLSAKIALQNDERFLVKQSERVAFGGYDQKSANQQMLDDGEEAGPGPASRQQQQQLLGSGAATCEDEDAMLAALSDKDRARVLKRLRKMQRRQEKEQQLREAEAILLAAGYNLQGITVVGGSGTTGAQDVKKSKASKKHKKGPDSHKRHKSENEKRHHKKRVHKSASETDSSS